MKVYLNSEEQTLNQGGSLSDLLEQKNFIHKKGIAVALNNSVIRRDAWEETPLSENDKILVIAATKGG